MKGLHKLTWHLSELLYTRAITLKYNFKSDHTFVLRGNDIQLLPQDAFFHTYQGKETISSVTKDTFQQRETINIALTFFIIQ